MRNSEPQAQLTRPDIPGVIRRGRVIAIGRGLDPETVPAIAEALVDGGVGAFEITMNSASALAVLSRLASAYAEDDLLVGAGTVLDLEQAKGAVEAGAHFLVMPHCDTEIIRWAASRTIPCFPGALTPTEALNAWRAGASAVKLFPASAVGPAFVREMRGPFAAIPLVPTGGVTLENAPSFIEAGAVAVGMGSWLTGGGDPVRVRERARAITDALAALDVDTARQLPAALPARGETRG
jgi:2-dehydro-3-deoxyphosphogluconate aldolase/(4S)-4-hydroxy-2-oxoglutarate aldolase